MKRRFLYVLAFALALVAVTAAPAAAGGHWGKSATHWGKSAPVTTHITNWTGSTWTGVDTDGYRWEKAPDKVACVSCYGTGFTGTDLPAATTVSRTTYLYNSSAVAVGAVSCASCLTWTRLGPGQNTLDHLGWSNFGSGIKYAGLAKVRSWYNSGELGWTYAGCAQTSTAYPYVRYPAGYNWQVHVVPGATC
jgi:hypothetical protein